MEQWSASEERPYLRPERNLYFFIVAVLAIIAAGSAAYYYYQLQPAAPERVAPAAAPVSQEAAVPQAAQGGIRNALPEPEAMDKPLPTLENSDSMMRESL